MASLNYRRRLEKAKTSFQADFNMKWDDDKQLFMSYLQTIYLSGIAEINYAGFIASAYDDKRKRLEIVAAYENLG